MPMPVPMQYWETHPGFRGLSKHEVSLQLLEQSRSIEDVLEALPPTEFDCYTVPLSVFPSTDQLRRYFVSVGSANIGKPHWTREDEAHRRDAVKHMAQNIARTDYSPSLAPRNPNFTVSQSQSPNPVDYVTTGPTLSQRDVEYIIERMATSMRRELDAIKSEIVQQVADEIQSIVAEIRDERR